MADALAVSNHDVLVVVDVQYDFCPGGALAVPGADEVAPLVNELATRFDTVVITQDWHPRGHLSFASSHPGRLGSSRRGSSRSGANARCGAAAGVGAGGYEAWPNTGAENSPSPVPAFSRKTSSPVRNPAAAAPPTTEVATTSLRRFLFTFISSFMEMAWFS